MRVGIVGSGMMGGKLGTIFAWAGHEVVFSYSRSEQRLAALVRDANGNASSGTPRLAALHADVVLLALHWSRMHDALSQVGDLSGKVVVTCCLPMNDEDTGLIIGHTTSGAEALQRKIPKAHVVAAFNTVPSEVLFSVYEARHLSNRPNLFYCGDHAGAKEAAVELIQDAGFAPVDAGALKAARYVEPFALLVGELAYRGVGGPEVVYRFERFGQKS